MMIFKQTIDLYKKSLSGLSREIWMLAFITFVNRAGLMVIPFLVIYLTEQKNFSIIEAGYILSSFGLGSVGGNILGGKLTDRFGQYYVQFISLILTGFGFWCLLFLQSLLSWCLCIFVLALIADSFRPANSTAIRVYSKPENQMRSLTLIRLSINLGFAFGPSIGGLIAISHGYSFLFILDGGTCLIAALLFIFLVPNRRISDVEQTVIPTTNEEIKAQVPDRSPYKDIKFVLFVMCKFCMAMAFIQFMSLMPLYFKQELQISEFLVGLLLGFNGLFIFVVEMPFIYKLENRKQNLDLIALGTFLIAAAYLILPFTSWAWIALISMFLLTIGEIISFPLSMSFALGRAHMNRVGAYMGLNGIAWSVGHVISPLIATYFQDNFGWDTTWLFFGGLCSLGAFGTYLLFLSIRKENI